jgi:hypothetical protein
MSTLKAQRALDDNLRHYVSADRDPAMHNLCVALRDLANSIQKIERDVDHLKAAVHSLGR